MQALKFHRLSFTDGMRKVQVYRPFPDTEQLVIFADHGVYFFG